MIGNLLEDIPGGAPTEIFTDLVRSDSVRIERIVSFGQSSPEGFWYDQEENEWVLLVEGSASLGFDDGSSLDLEPGDWTLIPAGRRHRVERTARDSRTIWLAVFFSDSSAGTGAARHGEG
jgi:cupin 2 domain-containing protein